MRHRRVLFALCIATATTTAAQQPPARVDINRMMATVRTLASPAMEGRRTGTPGGQKARDYVRKAYQEIGLDAIRIDAAGNVTGRVTGRDATSRTIVVSAHYDHVGIVNGTLYPGADDNASGIAALFECARYLRAHPPRHSFVFAAFDGEELDLRGARAFVRMPSVPLTSISLDINFDMVSRNAGNEIYAAGTFHYPSLRPILEEVQRRAEVKLLFGHDRPSRTAGMDDWTMESDHGAFHRAAIPFVYFGVEDHPDYHRPTDTPDKIDPAFFGRVTEMLPDAVIAFDRQMA